LQFKSSQRVNFIAGLCNSETGLRALHATDHWKDRGLDVTLSVGQRNLTGLCRNDYGLSLRQVL